MLSSTETPTVILLEKAKLFYHQQTTLLSKVSSANQGGLEKKTLNTEIEENKIPIWTEAKMEKTKDGKTVMTVPFKKYDLNNKDIAYARKYVFEENNGDIANGKIIEVIGGADFIAEEGESAIIRHKDRQIEGFSGAVISYDLNYHYIEGHNYQEGKQVPGIVRITSKSPNTPGTRRGQGKFANAKIPNKISTEIRDDGPTMTCTDWYLVVWYYDQYGDFLYSTETYLTSSCTSTGYVGPPPLGGGSIEVIVIDCSGVPNGTAYTNPGCNTCMGGNTGITECPPNIEVKQDSLTKHYPCMSKEIINKLLANNAYGKLIQPFQSIVLPNGNTINTPGLPNLTFDFSSQTYGVGNTYSLGQTSRTAPTFSGTSSKIEFNSMALENASKLFLQMTTIHETAHAYANYYVKVGNYGFPVDTTIYSTWAINVINFRTLATTQSANSNYTDHSIFIENYVDNFVKILKDLNGNEYTDKQYMMTAIYGLNNAGTPPPSSQPAQLYAYNFLKSTLLSIHETIKTKYSITTAELDAFYLANLTNVPAGKKLPTICP